MADEPRKPDFDDELTGSLADGLTDAAPTELMSGHEAIRAARQIGPYRLIEQIGEGGMGEVWLAEQTEGVWRKVALKVIRPGMDTRSFIARFEAERYVREGLEGRQRVLGEDHPTTLGSLINLGVVYLRQDQLRAAETLFLEAYRTSRQVLGDEHSTTLTAAGQVGAVYVGQGKNAEVLALLAPLEDVAREAFPGSTASRFALIERNLGIARARLATTPAEFAATSRRSSNSHDRRAPARRRPWSVPVSLSRRLRGAFPVPNLRP